MGIKLATHCVYQFGGTKNQSIRVQRSHENLQFLVKLSVGFYDQRNFCKQFVRSRYQSWMRGLCFNITVYFIFYIFFCFFIASLCILYTVCYMRVSRGNLVLRHCVPHNDNWKWCVMDNVNGVVFTLVSCIFTLKQLVNDKY